MTLYIVAALLVAAAIAFLLLKKKKGLGFGKKSAKTAEIKESPSFPETKVQSNAIDDQLRREIENNIRHRNYQVAEAQINTALHQDDTQHDLYYLLADVYLHQEDEFAFKQLINHLQQSQLYNLVDELNLRKEAFAQQKTQQAVSTPTSSPIEQAAVVGGVAAAGTAMDFDNLLSTPSNTTNTDNSMDFSFSGTQTETASNSLDFDSLINTSAPTQANTQEQSLDFDNLLGSNTPTETPTDFSFSTPTAETVATESNELDFSFSQSETQAPTVESNELDFSFSAPAAEVVNTETTELDFSFTQPSTETADLDLSFTTPTVETSVADVNELDLSFSAPTVETPKTEESFDFSFDEPTTATTTNEVPDLDLSFSAPTVETPKAEESFDFSFDEPTVAETVELSTPIVENTVPESNDFDFSFNESVAESSTVTESLDVETSPLIEPAVSFVEEKDLGVEEALVAGSAIVATALATEQIQPASNDPLVNQFSVLNNYDEITVNLKLASQYVNLGAYEAAHQLLAQRDNFDEQQNQQADAILERITA